MSVLLPIAVAGSLAIAGALQRSGSTNAGATRWFHGTDAKNLAEIRAHGLRGRAQQKRNAFAPLAGRVYATRDLGYALIYAAGGNVIGGAVPDFASFDGEGAVIEVAGQDPVPDEDWLGNWLSWVLKERNAQVTNARAYAAFERSRDWFKEEGYWSEDGWRTAVRVYHALPLRTRRAWDALDDRRSPLDDVTTHARLGKRAITELSQTREGRAILADAAALAPQASFPTPVRMLAAWTFDRRRDIPRLRKDGSNFFALATPVPGFP